MGARSQDGGRKVNTLGIQGMSYCQTHNQWYGAFCVYCGPPPYRIITSDSTQFTQTWEDEQEVQTLREALQTVVRINRNNGVQGAWLDEAEALAKGKARKNEEKK